jgi:hypothetical protein
VRVLIGKVSESRSLVVVVLLAHTHCSTLSPGYLAIPIHVNIPAVSFEPAVPTWVERRQHRLADSSFRLNRGSNGVAFEERRVMLEKPGGWAVVAVAT